MDGDLQLTFLGGAGENREICSRIYLYKCIVSPPDVLIFVCSSFTGRQLAGYCSTGTCGDINNAQYIPGRLLTEPDESASLTKVKGLSDSRTQNRACH